MPTIDYTKVFGKECIMEQLSIKSMLCVLKREIVMDSYFEHLKHMLTPMDKKRVYTQKFA